MVWCLQLHGLIYDYSTIVFVFYIEFNNEFSLKSSHQRRLLLLVVVVVVVVVGDS